MRQERTAWPEMVVATGLVTVVPALVVWRLYAAGVLTSIWAGVALSLALSLAATTAGTAIWRRCATGELLFCDLLLWNWLRRRRLERRLVRADDVLLEAGAADGEQQAALLSELSAALDAQDPYLDGHSRRVARYATMTARRMALGDARTADVRAAAIVHDIGKLRVPAEVLHKPGRLTDHEFEITKRHAGAGGAMLQELGQPALAAVVRAHHERWDGDGYPDGLTGEQIPLEARIISVADTFDAITTPRSYRPASAHKRALEVIDREAGRQLDPAAARAFIKCYTDRRGIVAWATGAWTALVPRARELAGSAVAASTAAVVLVVAVVASPGLTALGARETEPADAATGNPGTALVRPTAPPRSRPAGNRAPVRSAASATATRRPSHQRARRRAPAAPPRASSRPARGDGARSTPAPRGTPTQTPAPLVTPRGSRPTQTPAPSLTPRGSRPSSTVTPPRSPAHTPAPTPSRAPTQGSSPAHTSTPAPQPTVAATRPSPTAPAGTPAPSATAAPSPAHAAEACKGGGWTALGYRNQGQCVADAHRPS